MCTIETIQEKLQGITSPDQWHDLAETLRQFHYRIEGRDEVTIAQIVDNLIPGDFTRSALDFITVRDFALTAAGMADSIVDTGGGEHYVPRHNSEVYHTYDHFREAVLDTIVLARTINQMVENGAVNFEAISETEICILGAAMALHDWQRGLGPSEAGYGMEIRATEAFYKLAKEHGLNEDLMRLGAVAILSTSPFVAIDSHQTWFVAGQKTGSYAMLAEKVDAHDTLSQIEGLSDVLRNINAPRNERYLLIGQIASLGDVLSGTVLGDYHSIKNNIRVANETAIATDKDLPIWDPDGLAAAKAGKGFLSYLGQLPKWFNVITDNAAPAMLERYKAVVNRLEPPQQTAVTLA